MTNAAGPGGYTGQEENTMEEIIKRRKQPRWTQRMAIIYRRLKRKYYDAPSSQLYVVARKMAGAQEKRRATS